MVVDDHRPETVVDLRHGVLVAGDVVAGYYHILLVG